MATNSLSTKPCGIAGLQSPERIISGCYLLESMPGLRARAIADRSPLGVFSDLAVVMSPDPEPRSAPRGQAEVGRGDIKSALAESEEPCASSKHPPIKEGLIDLCPCHLSRVGSYDLNGIARRQDRSRTECVTRARYHLPRVCYHHARPASWRVRARHLTAGGSSCLGGGSGFGIACHRQALHCPLCMPKGEYVASPLKHEWSPNLCFCHLRSHG
mmetsp:Transcript_3792/g.8266  ORF Transcript_3792/g.8266 Transcript_3792/m.8266 type:complete len:215 (-) Transcript_3792:768-1412(-)